MVDRDPVTIHDLRKIHDLEGLSFLALLNRLSMLPKMKNYSSIIPMYAKNNSDFSNLKMAEVQLSEKIES